ncbi:MAG: RES domain-containing protein [Salinisphaeraceae bacterium]
MSTAQKLDRTLTAYRIGDPGGVFPIFDATGSTRFPGRWNDEHTPVIYASRQYSAAMLEKLAASSGLMPPNQHYVEITLPRGLSYECVTPDLLPGWDARRQATSRAFAVSWATEARSAILLVPCFVARLEQNVIINPHHPEFSDIEVGLPMPVWWDRRLFNR